MILRDASPDEWQNIPREFNLSRPRSHCCNCGHTLGVLQLIPLLSWLWQGGRCCWCGTSVSGRYPLIELITGLLFAAAFSFWPELTIALPLSLFFSVLTALLAIDLEHMLLPDILTLFLLWCGLLWNASGYGFVCAEESLYAAAMGYLSLWSTNLLYRLVRKKDGMGYGDFKLLAAVGAWLGIDNVSLVLLAAPFIGLIFWGISGSRTHDAPLPFGPAIIVSTLLSLTLYRFFPALMEYVGLVFPVYLS